MSPAGQGQRGGRLDGLEIRVVHSLKQKQGQGRSQLDIHDSVCGWYTISEANTYRTVNRSLCCILCCICIFLEGL
jgi:hypothetical protein